MKEIGVKESLNIIFNHVSLKNYGYFFMIKRSMFSLIYPFILLFQAILWCYLDENKRSELRERRKNKKQS